MNQATQIPTSAQKKASARRGVVLIAVLVVTVILSLAGYQYSEMMLAEYKVSENAHRAAQARALADAGVHYAASLLSDQGNFGNVGNPFDNESMFRDIAVEGDGGLKGRFSLIAPANPGDPSAGMTYGVMDEGGKLNLNALMKIDPTGQKCHDMLMKLPNMTEEIAAAIIDWMDPDSDTRPGGAENDYYMGLNPPYRCKNGMIDSVGELLLVRGVTRELLYGTDWNRNHVADDDEVGFDRGWSAYLTLHSREQNYDTTGKPFIFLGNQDLQQLALALADTEVDPELAKFIIMYRQYGPMDQKSSGLGATIAAALGIKTQPKTSSKEINEPAELGSYEVKFNKSGSKKIKSVFDLVNTAVRIKDRTDKNGNTYYKVYESPLNDINNLRNMLPKLFGVATLKDPTVETEIPPRINVNTASLEVLASLSAVAEEITDADLAKIDAARQGADLVNDPTFQSPAWLYTEAQISEKTLRKLENYITTRTQVFRVQSVGYFDGPGPAVRVEAIIDTNSGRPRIVAWRNMTDLGKGWNSEKKP